MRKLYKMAIPMMLLSFSLIGCVSTTTASRVALVSPENSKNIKWAISAKANSGGFNDNISIFINDEKVAEGGVSIMTPRNNLTGTYKGKKIDAECMATLDVGIMSGHKCTIYIDSNKVTELSF